MGKARLIRAAFLTGLLAMSTLFERRETASDERSEWEHFNERCASDSLKTLTAPEPDFRANDRDWCHVNDFWAGDVTGLYTMTPAAKPAPGEKRDFEQ